MNIENSIHIDAPQAVVWSVTEDIEHWPQWMPTMTSVKRLDAGPFDVGSAALIKQPGLPEAQWVVTEMARGERFTWETRILGLSMMATHELTTAESGGTLNVLRLKISGAATLLLWPVVRLSVRWALERENATLKAKCEASGLSR